MSKFKPFEFVEEIPGVGDVAILVTSERGEHSAVGLGDETIILSNLQAAQIKAAVQRELVIRRIL